jgi:hypothetical protein
VYMLSTEERKLLRRVFGIQVGSDGSLWMRLSSRFRPVLVSVSSEFIAPGLLLALWSEFGDHGGPRRISLWVYFLVILAIRITHLLWLLQRRSIAIPAGENVAVLRQGGREFRLSAKPWRGTRSQSSKAMVRLDGGPFGLRRNVFASRRQVAQALGTLHNWLHARWAYSLPGNGELSIDLSVGPFLALFHVTEVADGKVSFRVADFRPRLFLLCMFSALFPGLIGIACLDSVLVLGNSFAIWDVFAVAHWLWTIAVTVAHSLWQIEVTVEAGRGIRIRNGSRVNYYPASTCSFAVQEGCSGDLSDTGRISPHIKIRPIECVVMRSHRNSEEELAVFADTMNHYLWGVPCSQDSPGS